MKYLVYQKRFTTENDILEKKDGLENTKEVVAEFKGKMKTEVK